jgi:ketosteroid isomerase-like protein
MGDERESVAAAMRKINDAWIARRVEDLAAMVHEEIVMVFPGFAGRIQGREAFLAGFRDFSENARILHFHEGEHQIDVAGETAVVNFSYEMLYERSAKQYRATGRDLWVFEKQGAAWLAVWRTMLDLNETPA